MRIYFLSCIFFVLLGIEKTLAGVNVCPDKWLNLTNVSVDFCGTPDSSDKNSILFALYSFSREECSKLCSEDECPGGSCKFKDVLILPDLNDNAKVEWHLSDSCPHAIKIVVKFGTSKPYGTVCLCDCPKEVKLTSFKAIKVNNGVLVQWETATECKTSGFVLWKAKPLDGICTNNQSNYLFPIPLLEVPARGGNSWGGLYPYENNPPYIDEDGNDEFCYGLQEIEDGGEWNLHVTEVED